MSPARRGTSPSPASNWSVVRPSDRVGKRTWQWPMSTTWRSTGRAATEPVEIALGEDTQLDVLAYSPDGRLLAVTGRAGDRAVVVVYDADRLQRRRRVDVGEATPGGVSLRSVAITDDGDIVAGSDVGTLVIDRGGVRADIDLGRERAVLAVAVGPGGELLAGDKVDAVLRCGRRWHRAARPPEGGEQPGGE